jgi:hypothetical protein
MGEGGGGFVGQGDEGEVVFADVFALEGDTMESGTLLSAKGGGRGGGFDREGGHGAWGGVKAG